MPQIERVRELVMDLGGMPSSLSEEDRQIFNKANECEASVRQFREMQEKLEGKDMVGSQPPTSQPSNSDPQPSSSAQVSEGPPSESIPQPPVSTPSTGHTGQLRPTTPGQCSTNTLTRIPLSPHICPRIDITCG